MSDIKFIKVPGSEFWQRLECVPPRLGGYTHFLVGEAADHRGPNGKARYEAYFQDEQGSHYKANRPITCLEFSNITLGTVINNVIPE